MTGVLPADPHMLDVLQGFVHELRNAGLPVSMTENLDAMRAIEHVPLDERAAFKAALVVDAGEERRSLPASSTRCSRSTSRCSRRA